MRTAATVVSCLAAALAIGMATAAEKSEYRLGDRLPQKPAASAPAGYKEIPWDALVPADWNPAKEFAGLNFATMSDADPRAIAALEKLRAAWDNAPVVPSLNGTRVRIPGFLVPLESQQGMVREFLLVPYFGACIHTPPPPANQIIHVFPAKPYKTEQGMDAVWVSGIMETTRTDTGLGVAGYRIKADLVTPYKR
jgi:uncharacterized protein